MAIDNPRPFGLDNASSCLDIWFPALGLLTSYDPRRHAERRCVLVQSQRRLPLSFILRYNPLLSVSVRDVAGRAEGVQKSVPADTEAGFKRLGGIVNSCVNNLENPL